MTVSALITRNDITATASQTVFIYTFRVIEATDMAVYQNGVLLSSGYTVTGVNNTTGGTVVLDTGASVGQIVSLVLAMPLDRTTNYQNSGKFLADDVNEDFDKIYIGAIQNENLNDRSLRLQDVEPPTAGVDMTIPLKADRKGKFLAFDSTTGGPIATTGSSLYDSAAWIAYNFTGNGSTTAFTLGSDPASENNTQVYIDGVYQQKDGYSVAGAVLTFSVAPPNLSTIEVMVASILPIGSTVDQPTRADLVSYLPSGTGAVATTVQTKLRESVSVKDFGAVGDGTTDDTAAVQAAIDSLPTFSPPSVGYPVLKFESGAFYKITDNGTYGILINKRCIIEGNGCFIDYRGSQRAIRINSDHVTLRDITIVDYGQSLSVDINTLSGTGIQVLNSQYCRLSGIRVERYAYGFSFYGENAATANIDCYSCDAVNNYRNITCSYDDTNYPTGASYVTKINWYGGSAQVLSSTFSSIVGSHGISMINPRGDSGYVVDGIVFHGVLTEGYAERKLYSEAKWCAYYDCYWDTQGPTTTDIEFTSISDNNRIAGGSSLDLQVISNSGTGNIIDDKNEYITSAKQTINNQVDISGSNAGQIKFPTTANPSADANTLDDYEENLAWSPSITNETNISSTTVTNAQYIKVGRLVTINGVLSGTVTTGATLTYLRLVLPFNTHQNAQGATGVCVDNTNAIGFARDWGAGSGDSIQILFAASSGITSGVKSIDFSFTYVSVS